MPNDSYLYLPRQIAKFMMSTQNMSNYCGLVRTQMMSKQNMSNSRVCYMNDSELKSVHINKIESKRIKSNACSTDKSKSKSVHKIYISVNTNKVKDTNDENLRLRIKAILK